MEKRQKEDEQRNLVPSEEGLMQKAASKILEANFIGMHASEKNSRYARTQVSREEFAQREAQQRERARKIALSHKRK